MYLLYYAIFCNGLVWGKRVWLELHLQELNWWSYFLSPTVYLLDR